MNLSATTRPATDPTPLFEHFRGAHGTELLTAAVAHFDVFGILAQRPLTIAQLREEVNLDERPAVVLTTALRAMGLLELNARGELTLTPLARRTVESMCELGGLSSSRSSEIVLAVHEARTNIVRHAHGNQPHLPLTIAVRASGTVFEIKIAANRSISTPCPNWIRLKSAKESVASTSSAD